MTKVDQLIEKFKEFQEELNKACPCGGKTSCPASCPCPKSCKCKSDLKKNANCSAMPNPTTGTSGGQGGMYRSEDIAKGGPGGEDVMAMSEEVIKFDKNGQWSLDKSSDFKKLQHKIEGQGHSKESAGAITASIGRKDIGQKEMTARSKAGMNKVDPEENVNIPHPQGKATMANGVNKDENIDGTNRQANPKMRMKDAGPIGDVHMIKDETDSPKLGTNQRLANPPEGHVSDGRGNVHMVKDEGTNEEAASSKPHNKGKFKVMDEVEEKESKKANAAGLPYNGDDKAKKSEKHEEQRAQNKARHDGFGL
jgi:hypothetical protein